MINETTLKNEVAVTDERRPPMKQEGAISHWTKSIPLLIFVLAFFVRLGYWSDSSHDLTHGFNDFHWLAGAPISDANMWVDFGEVIRRGCVKDHDWVARRPLYGYFLASIYTLTDARLSAAQWANVIMSSLSVMFVYSITCRLFGVAAGLGAALWFCFEPHSIHLSIVPLTETIGCFFTVWHLWWLIRANDGKQFGYIGAGFAFAAANLTRTLSLFALPMEVLLIWLVSARHRQSIWKGFTSAFLFGASVTFLLVLGMLRNYWLVGVFTISDNTSSILYAATSPDFGSWSAEVELETHKLGIKSTKDRYDYYMDKAKENLKKDPLPYLNRVQTMWWGIVAVSLDIPWFYWFQLLFSGTLIASALATLYDQNYSRVTIERRLLFLAVIAIVVAWIYWSGDVRCRWLIWSMAILAFARSLFRLDQGLIVANLWFWSVMGVAAFGVFSDRFVLMFDWLLAIGVFGGLSILTRLIARGVFGRFPSLSVTPVDVGFTRIAHAGLLAIFALLITSGYIGISAECIPLPGTTEVKNVNARQSLEAILASSPSTPDVIKDKLRRALIFPRRGDPNNAKAVGLSNVLFENDQRRKGHLMLTNARRIGGPYRIPPNAGYDCSFEIAKSRPYERTILEIEGATARKSGCKGWVTFDGILPDEVVKGEFLIVGFYDHYDVSGFNDLYEAVAIFPLADNGDPMIERGMFAQSAEHLKRVRELIADKPAN